MSFEKAYFLGKNLAEGVGFETVFLAILPTLTKPPPVAFAQRLQGSRHVRAFVAFFHLNPRKST